MATQRSCVFLSAESSSPCRAFRHTDTADRWYLDFSLKRSLHAHVHYFSHTQFWVLSELFCPLSFSKWLRNQYSVLKLVLLMWLCVKSWGMCKSPVYSPTSAPPAKEHWVHTEGCSVCSACFSAWYRLTYPPTYHFSISPSLLTFRCLFFYLIFSCFKDSSL